MGTEWEARLLIQTQLIKSYARLSGRVFISWSAAMYNIWPALPCLAAILLRPQLSVPFALD